MPEMEDPGDPSLAVNPASLSFTVAGESKSFSVSSGASWTVVSSEPWATVSPASGTNNGTVTVTAAANTSTSQRTATITVTGGGITRTVDVTQAGVSAPAASLTVSPASLSFAAASESKSFSVSSDANWTVVSSEPWATVSPASGANNGTVTVTAAANTSTSQRTVTITVTGGGVTKTVDVTQAAGVPPETVPDAVSLDLHVVSLKKDETVQLTATVTPADATDPAVEWTSSDPQVATVSATGLVTAVAEGTATVTVRTVSGDRTDACTVTVTAGDSDGNEIVGPSLQVTCFGGVLTVASPSAEQVDIYSPAGTRLYSARKASGTETFRIGHLPHGVVIVRGRSGWGQKVVLK
ncbi:MAG: Ig-like domain-containing protein [Tannerella sp.]|nr:Ig-like domain-containing protein [Tannerella sp.]